MSSFFKNKRTLTLHHVWLASYHLVNMAQTWYYVMEQDEFMPSWERFKELCNLCFALVFRGTRLSKLARHPFLTMF